jgi:hypothetical protein
VLSSFFTSRRNCGIAVLGGVAHWLAREGLEESQFRRGDIICGTLYIHVLFAVYSHPHRGGPQGRTETDLPTVMLNNTNCKA